MILVTTSLHLATAYRHAWFVGFFVAAATYHLLMLKYKAATPARSTP
jgi:cytosine/uracil/thiamine/allantoin permease